MDLLGGQQVLLPLIEGLQQLHELGLHGEALAVHLVRALPLLAQGLRLALELFYLLLPHLHLILQHLKMEDTPTFTPETRETQTVILHAPLVALTKIEDLGILIDTVESPRNGSAWLASQQLVLHSVS